MLFITYVGAGGNFFGQLEGRSLQELNSVLSELTDVYDKDPDPHLLYSDVQSHCGDFAVVKWSADNTYYRVRIEEELPNDIIVKLVDYGNIVTVPRAKVLATVNALKYFGRPAFGISCVVNDVTIPEDQWILLLNDKSVHVKLGVCYNGIYQVTVTESLVNSEVLIALNAFSRSLPLTKPNDLMIKITPENGDYFFFLILS